MKNRHWFPQQQNRPLIVIVMKSLSVLFLAGISLASAQLTELQPILEVAGVDSNAGFGWHACGIGDINKDGYADVAVSLYYKGISRIYLGGKPMSGIPAYTIWGNSRVASGDFNADGLIDLAIGKVFNDSVGIYLGGTVFDTIPDVILTIEAGRASEFLTLAAGDIDGDGYDDLVVGSPNYLPDDTLKNRVGKLYVFAGGSIVTASPAWTVEGELSTVDHLGLNIAVGDVNTDGKDDLVALGRMFRNGRDTLKLALFLGKSDFQLQRDYFFSAKQDTENFFYDYRIEIFDCDGDYTKDIVVDGIFVYRGGSTISASPTYRVATPTNYEEFFGNFPVVWGSGDFNSDGVLDFLFGTSRSLPSGVRGFHVMFSRRGIPGSDYKAFRTYSFDRNFYLTGWPANAGDVNGDGMDDVIIGAPTEPITTRKGFFGVYSGDSNIVTSVVNDPSRPNGFILEQNYPNPFNPSTAIKYRLSETGNVCLKIFDTLGREVVELVNEKQSAGEHQTQWSGVNSKGERVSTGTYFYQLTVNGFIITKKALLVK